MCTEGRAVRVGVPSVTRASELKCEACIWSPLLVDIPLVPSVLTTRRRTNQLLSLITAFALPTSLVLAQSTVRTAADLILTGGRIFTADSTHPWATAIAIRGDRILAVGTDAEVERLRSPRTRHIALGGKVVVPGFNDAHAHLGGGIKAINFATGDSPTPDPTLSVVLDSIAAVARRTPTGTWITTSVAETVLGDPMARRATLDRVAPRHNVYLLGWSGHGGVLNSGAIRASQIDTLHDPVGGWFERTASGVITGRIDEYLHYALLQQLTIANGVPSTVAAFAAQNGESAAFGITSVQDMTTGFTPSMLAAVSRAGVLKVRHRVIPFEMTRVGGRATTWNAVRRVDARTTVSGAKWVLDGTPIERLALMRAPYADRAGWYGRGNFSLDSITALLRDALRRKQQPMLHAVGDSTIALVFSAMRAVAPDSVWRAIRPRIEHGDQLMEDQFADARKLGIVVVQNPTHLTLALLRDRWGPDRAARSDVLRGMVAAGIPLAIGSDGPANTGLNVMLASINPANPSHALTREQAVTAYTLMSAYAEHAEREKGSLVAGKLADLAVLSQDIFSVPLPALPGTTSLLTMVGGRLTLDRMSSVPRGSTNTR